MLRHLAQSLSDDAEAAAVAVTGSQGHWHCRSEWAGRAAGLGRERGSGLGRGGGGGCVRSRSGEAGVRRAAPRAGDSVVTVLPWGWWQVVAVGMFEEAVGVEGEEGRQVAEGMAGLCLQPRGPAGSEGARLVPIATGALLRGM